MQTSASTRKEINGKGEYHLIETTIRIEMEP